MESTRASGDERRAHGVVQQEHERSVARAAGERMRDETQRTATRRCKHLLFCEHVWQARWEREGRERRRVPQRGKPLEALCDEHAPLLGPKPAGRAARRQLKLSEHCAVEIQQMGGRVDATEDRGP